MKRTDYPNDVSDINTKAENDDESVISSRENFSDKDIVETPENPNEAVYLIRANYIPKDARDVGGLIDYLYENDIVSINLRDDKGSDEKEFCDLFSGGIKSLPLQKNYINRFHQLSNDVQISDIITIALYPGKNPKIGLIKKGSKVFTKEEKGDIYLLKCLKMENVQCVTSDSKKRFLSTLIPENVTISRVIKKKEVVISMYNGAPIPLKLSNVSDSKLEDLCAEYLRKCHKYQSVLVLGGTFPDIDLIGYKNSNELFVAQVSSAKSKKLIENKIDNLCKFEEAKCKIMFSTLPTNENSHPLNYNIQDVWDYFAKDESNNQFLEWMVML